MLTALNQKQHKEKTPGKINSGAMGSKPQPRPGSSQASLCTVVQRAAPTDRKYGNA